MFLDSTRNTPALSSVRVLRLVSDGEACRSSALDLLTARSLLAEDSPIFPLLPPLKLMDLNVRNDDLTTEEDKNVKWPL